MLAETATAAEHARHFDRAIELNLRAVPELIDVDPIREAAIWLQLRDLYRFQHRWDDCAHTVTRALALIPETDSDLACSWGVALIRQGRLDEARALIELIRTALTRGVWSEGVGWLAAAVVMFDAAEGRYGDAAALVDATMARSEPGPGDNTYLVATGIAALSDSAADGGTRETKERAAARATKWLQWSDATEHLTRQPTVEATALPSAGARRAPTPPRRIHATSVGPTRSRLGAAGLPLPRGRGPIPPRRSAPRRHHRARRRRTAGGHR